MTIAAVIAVYNGAGLIRRSMESVLAQTRAPDEFLVIDDGSTDETGAMVRSYGARVRYVHQKNSGVAAARNRAVREAVSEWIAFLDHDDEWLPRKLEAQAAAVEADRSAALCYTAYWLHGIEGSKRLAHVPPGKIWPSARMRNPFPPSVVMVRRREVLELGGFYEGLQKAGVEDWEFFARFLAHHPRAAAVGEGLANYYEVPTSASRNYRKMLADSLEILERGLLTGLRGPARAWWRRRIKSMVYYRIAISAQENGDPAGQYLVQSFRQWPLPDLAPKRLQTAAAWWWKTRRGG